MFTERPEQHRSGVRGSSDPLHITVTVTHETCNFLLDFPMVGFLRKRSCLKVFSPPSRPEPAAARTLLLLHTARAQPAARHQPCPATLATPSTLTRHECNGRRSIHSIECRTTPAAVLAAVESINQRAGDRQMMRRRNASRPHRESDHLPARVQPVQVAVCWTRLPTSSGSSLSKCLHLSKSTSTLP